MARKAELKAVLKLDNLQFARSIRQSIQMARDLARQFARQPIRTSFLAGVIAARTAVRGTGKVIETFGRVALGVFNRVTTGSLILKATVAAAFGFFAHKILEAASAAEDYRTVFTVLLGTAEKASARMKNLLDWANFRGIRLSVAAEASRTLETLTRGALSTGKGLEFVGNIAAGTNTKFEDMSVTIGRLYDQLRTGFGGGEQLMRLQDLGAITGQQRRRISALGTAKFGAEAWKEAQKALARFDGMMQTKSTNWSMRMEKFRDSVEEAMRQFGTPLMEALKPALTSLTDLIFAVAPKLSEVGKAFGEHIAKATGFLTETLGDPKKLLDAFKAGMEAVIGGSIKLLVGGLEVGVKFFKDGLTEGVVALVQFAGSALLDAFNSPIAHLRAGFEKAIEGLLLGLEVVAQVAKGIGGLMNPFNLKENSKDIFEAVRGLVKGDKGQAARGSLERIMWRGGVQRDEVQRKKDLFAESIMSRKSRYLQFGEDQKRGLDSKASRNLSESLDGLIRAFKETRLPEAVRAFSAAAKDLAKSISKKHGPDPDEIRKRMTDQIMVHGPGRLRTGGLQAAGLQAAGGLDPYRPFGRTPLIRFRERRAVDMATRAGVQAALGGREPGDTKIRRGDRRRMQEAQRERLREKMDLEKTNQILEAIQKSFDALVK